MIKKFVIILLTNITFMLYLSANSEQLISLSQNLDILSNLLKSIKIEKIEAPKAKESKSDQDKLKKEPKPGKIGDKSKIFEKNDDEKIKPKEEKKDKSKKEPIVISKEPQAINIQGFNIINTTLTSVFGTPNIEKFQTVEKKKYKDKAREFLNALHILIKSTTNIPAKNKDVVYQSALKMLYIDPLLISTVIAVLKDSGQPQEKIYEVMKNQFEKQIEFLEKEFKEIVKPKFPFTEGVKNDIDEALSYQPAISDEIQIAELKKRLEKDPQANQFIDEINKLQKRLADLLRKNAKVLEKNDIPLESYLEMMETQIRPSCRVACPTGYISIYSDLDEIQKSIKNYNDKSKRYRLSQRILAKQSIINKLSSFLTYLNVKDPSFCQVCLNNDINSRPDYDINGTFDLIKNFFENLPIYEKNAGTQKAINIAQELKELMLARKRSASSWF